MKDNIKNPLFEDINRLFYRFHNEFECIVMDMLGDKISYNLMNSVFVDFDEVQEEYHNKLRKLYGEELSDDE